MKALLMPESLEQTHSGHTSDMEWMPYNLVTERE